MKLDLTVFKNIINTAEELKNAIDGAVEFIEKYSMEDTDQYQQAYLLLSTIARVSTKSLEKKE